MQDTKHAGSGSDFASAAQGRPSGFLSEFWFFLRHNRRWWITPVVVLLLALGLLVVLGGSGAAPFIYTLF